MTEKGWSNPFVLVTLPKPSRPRDKVIEKHELDKLMAALPKRVAPIVDLAYETTMRRSEIVKLRAKHLHLDQRLLRVINGKEGDRSVQRYTHLNALDVVKLWDKVLQTKYAAVFA